MNRFLLKILKAASAKKSSFSLLEAISAVVIISLFVGMVTPGIIGRLSKSLFNSESANLVNALQFAAASAAKSEKRYEVIINITEQSFTLRQITSPDLDQIFDEDIIIQQTFSSNCRIDYVIFDDLVHTDENHQIAKFRAGHSGWQNGGKIVLLDRNLQPYSLIVSRLNKLINIKKGDVSILLPKAEDEIPF
jgi:Tfp pilus assembly protein FimT